MTDTPQKLMAVSRRVETLNALLMQLMTLGQTCEEYKRRIGGVVAISGTTAAKEILNNEKVFTIGDSIYSAIVPSILDLSHQTILICKDEKTPEEYLEKKIV